MEVVKHCPKCKRTLPIAEFAKDAQRKDGRASTCRECHKALSQAHYKRFRGKYLEAQRKRRESEPERVFHADLTLALKSPTKRNARKAVSSAVRAGELFRPNVCFGCGCSADERRIEAHHHDYSRPLAVVWLCTSCHRKLDQARREQEEIEAKRKANDQAEAQAKGQAEGRE